MRTQVLTDQEFLDIDTKIQNLSHPKGFREDKSRFDLYNYYLRQILVYEAYGSNKDITERLKDVNHQLIRPYVEQYNF